MGRRGDDRARFDRRDGELLHAGPTWHTGSLPPSGGSGISRLTPVHPSTWEMLEHRGTDDEERARDIARALRGTPVYVLPDRETHDPTRGSHTLRGRLARTLRRIANHLDAAR